MEKIWDKLQEELKFYMHRNSFKSVVLGLSGGLDSALTAVLSADALGGANVTAVMMKTKFTSDLSLRIAREISKLNSLNYLELDIEPLVQKQTAFLQGIVSEQSVLYAIYLQNARKFASAHSRTTVNGIFKPNG